MSAVIATLLLVGAPFAAQFSGDRDGWPTLIASLLLAAFLFSL